MTDYANITIEQLESMSDEEFAKLDPSQLPTDSVEQPQPTVDEQQPEAVPVPEVFTEPTPEPTPQGEAPNEGEPNENASEAEQSREGSEPSAGGEQPAEPKTDTPTEVTPEQEFYQKVTAKFQANGREFQVDSAEDVVSLMQKGLNYNQKMAAIKPGMKIIKALQEKGIQSVEQLGELFDLMDKKPEAIAKLVQDSGIDTYDLTEEKAKAYQPSTPEVSDELINFEMVAQSLESHPSFGRVVQELGHFDESTKKEIFEKPQLLNVLTEHVANGFYDQIVSRLEREQAVGRYLGVPFLQAYDALGQQMFAQPVPVPAAQVPVPQPVPVPVPVATKPNTVNNTARQAAAGAPTISNSPKQSFTVEDLYNMSDEDFAKIDPKFLK